MKDRYFLHLAALVSMIGAIVGLLVSLGIVGFGLSSKGYLTAYEWLLALALFIPTSLQLILLLKSRLYRMFSLRPRQPKSKREGWFIFISSLLVAFFTILLLTNIFTQVGILPPAPTGMKMGLLTPLLGTLYYQYKTQGYWLWVVNK